MAASAHQPRTDAKDSASPDGLRAVMITFALFASISAGSLYLGFSAPGGITWIDLVRAALMVVTVFWIVWGGLAGVIGVFLPRIRPSFDGPVTAPEGRTVVIVPIYNEDPVATFARIAAMNRSVVDLGIAEKFDVAVLSDTTSPQVAAEEAIWFARLLEEPLAEGRIFYRRRLDNVGRKAGNIEEFVRRSGGAYDYAIVLDADSLVEGRTMCAMAQRMDREPTLGLLQSVPRVINARSFFGRAMQFSAGYLSPGFSRGSASLQGTEGPYWGHNAIIRMRAFAAHCGLPTLSGPPPHGGHILSHDYVEAALLARAGYRVVLDPHLEGSYEEGPENIVEFAKRDRRWCQGNLQHRRLIATPGLRFWHRFTFVQGIMAYMASPLWLALLGVSLLSAVLPDQLTGSTIFVPRQVSIWELTVIVGLVLVLPKLMLYVRSLVDGENAWFGGNLRAGISVLAEILLSTITAPIMLMFQTRAVVQVLLGRDGGWPATARSAGRLTLRDAWLHSWWIVCAGLFILGLTAMFALSVMLWVLPVTIPAILAPVLICLTSRGSPAGAAGYVFGTPEETWPSPVVADYRERLGQWSARPLGEHPPVALPSGAAAHA